MRVFQPAELDTLAAVYYDPLRQRMLLAVAGFPRERLPSGAPDAVTFWRQVDELLHNGTLRDGRRRILAAALEEFPANPVFKAGAQADAPADAPAEQGTATEPANAAGPPVWPLRAPSPTDARPDFASFLIVLGLDVSGFSALTGRRQEDVRDTLGQMIVRALTAARVPLNSARAQDTGDGCYITFPATEVGVATIVADVTDEIARALAYHNAGRDTGDGDGRPRIRLRLAVNRGDATVHGSGWTGRAVIATARLLDSRPARAVLTGIPAADLVQIISADTYEAAVLEEERGLRPATFVRAEVEVKSYRGVGWLRAPGQPVELLRAVLAPFGASPAGGEAPPPGLG